MSVRPVRDSIQGDRDSIQGNRDSIQGNQVSAVVAELPVAVRGVEERYAAVREEVERLKASHEAEAAEAVTELADLAPPVLLALGTRAVTRALRHVTQRNVNTVVTNVPGPQHPLYAAGRRMTHHHPYVPVAHGVRVAVAVFSYDGRLFFGITGDREAAPDVGVLADGIEAGFAELVDLAG